MSATAQIDPSQGPLTGGPVANNAANNAGVAGGNVPPASESREPPYGAYVVVTGLLAMVAVFVVSVLHYKTAADVATAVGAVSAVVAALVGAYFGIRGATLAQKTAAESSSTPPRG